jgi:hypothetical protein
MDSSTAADSDDERACRPNAAWVESNYEEESQAMQRREAADNTQ